ncbi:tyrosine-type recombinase/integrase [Lysinibacillus sp. M3]|uniref:Tyrosine-type recombinase/integrase n=1 Tax=Lysinibacillus zambalensis TaxID=3160866 RepID=A0ABV1MY90_9BACI
MDVEVCIKHFALDYKFRMSPTTLRIYQGFIKQFINQLGKTVKEITKKDVRNWITYLSAEKGYQPSTINSKIAALKLFFNYCLEEGLVSQDPTKDIKFVFVKENPPHYLLKEQIMQLRAFLEGQTQERAIMEVLYATGVRIGELVAMEKKDINWTERSIIIPEGKRKLGRIVLFTSECAEHLKAYLDSRTDNYPTLFVLFNSDGTRTNNGKIVEEWFRYYSKKLGFKVTPHTLRHTFAAHLAQRGMPVECIRTLLGHEKYQTTRIYAKLFDLARKEMYD